MARAAAKATFTVLSLALRARAQLRIVAPASLQQKFPETHGKIEGSTATFGAPFYGDEVLGRLVWGDSKKGEQHCTQDDYQVPEPPEISGSAGYKEIRLINIIMVRRGKCSFVKKVKVAREKGAHAVVIVDKEDSTLTAQDVQRIIVADDGYGDEIRIPSVLISKDDGAPLIEAARNGEVIVELSWDVPTNHVVGMDLWMSSGSRSNMRFMRDFAPKRRTLNEVMSFTPHFAVFSIPSSDVRVFQRLCSDNAGTYCAEDPDGSGDVTGQDVLRENLRQLCIHKLTKVPRTFVEDLAKGKPVVEYAGKYWDYMERVGDECPVEGTDEARRLGDACSQRLMAKVGLDTTEVVKCVEKNKEDFLQKELENKAWSPQALRINGWRYNGRLEPDLVTRAVCAGFIHRPKECNNLLKPRDPRQVYAPSPNSGGVSLRAFVMALLGILAIVGAVLFLYRRSLKRNIQREIREEVMLEVQAQTSAYRQLASF